MQAVIPPEKPKVPYVWICRGCKKSGTIEIEEHADVMTGYYVIKEDHNKQSPNCQFDLRKVKVKLGKVKP